MRLLGPTLWARKRRRRRRSHLALRNWRQLKPECWTQLPTCFQKTWSIQHGNVSNNVFKVMVMIEAIIFLSPFSPVFYCPHEPDLFPLLQTNSKSKLVLTKSSGFCFSRLIVLERTLQLYLRQRTLVKKFHLFRFVTCFCFFFLLLINPTTKEH